MFLRPSWTMIFSYAAGAGLNFTQAFNLGRSMGLGSYRRIIMLGDWNTARGFEVSKNTVKYLPKNAPVADQYLAPGYLSQPEKYMYRVQITGVSAISGQTMTQTVSLHTAEQLSLNDLETLGLESFGGDTGMESYGVDVEEVHIIGGFLRPSW